MSNPNFPRIEHGWGAMWGANGGALPLDSYVDVTERTTGSVATQAGRQYELDQVQSATLSASLLNTDGLLDPTNSTGPWYGHIAPYQPYRVRAQWPPTANLLTQSLAAAVGVPLGAVDSNATGFSGLTPTSVAAADAFGNSGVAYQCAVPLSLGARVAFAWSTQVAVKPGQHYAFTAHVRNLTASTSLPVAAALIWRDATGANDTTVYGATSTLVGSASPSGWTTITVTGTAPANVAGVYLSVLSPNATTAAYAVQTSGWQLEEGSAATAWGMPGTWYPIYGGFAERWPQTWTMAGSLGTVQPTGVDAFALLSQRQLDNVFLETVNNYAPRYVFLFDDPEGSDSASEAAGRFPPAPLRQSKVGPGVATFGTQVTATDAANGVYVGSGESSVVHLENPNPGVAGNFASSYFSLTDAGIAGPVDTTQPWTRAIAFRYTGPLPPYSAELWCAGDRQVQGSSVVTGSNISLYINSAGNVALNVGKSDGTFTTVANSAVNVVDGNWHFVMFAYDVAANIFHLDVDNHNSFRSSANSFVPTNLAFDVVGALADPYTKFVTDNFSGDIGFIAEWSLNFATVYKTEIYNAWKNAFTGESTGTRYSRIVKYAGFTGSTSIATGDTTSMGPADFSGQDALSALQAVVDTEGGEHFVDASGKIVFRARSARYNLSNPVYTFGEDVAAGEWPYEDCQLDHDPTHLGNIAQVTQSSTGGIFTAQNTVSQAQYFPRTLQRTVNTTDPLEAQDAAAYLVSRYAQPQTRVSTLTLHPAGHPAMWGVALSLGLGMRIRVNRRPPGRAPISIECFVEQMSWNFSDGGDAVLTLQCSPADTTLYGVIGAWHSKLTASVALGGTSLTVDPSTCNPAQLKTGQQLVLGANTVIETVTVNSVSGNVVTLVAGVAHAHTSGAPLNEALPTGVTDPATYDGADIFDSIAFTY